jgi:methionine-S-sulfoxide reductase
MADQLETAIFGGGCFWCTEAIFKMLNGVESVVPGYAGGEQDNPNYHQVSGGSTGHAEVIKLEFNPQVISYEQLLEVFFATHDPTTLNRQGNDVGSQYRSVILHTSEAQRNAAVDYIAAHKDEFDNRVTTEVKELEKFYDAESYHFDYFAKNPDQPYCQLVVSPKVEKFKAAHPELIK